jgi:LysM repeat protein
MKKTVCVFAAILAVFLTFSCTSTGNTSGVVNDVAGSSVDTTPAPERPPESQVLEQIYNQYESEVILTGAREYVVVRGDTLSKVARDSYGPGSNAYFFPLIIAASKGSANILDPDEIEVGMMLIIPDLQENLDDPNARSNLKNLIWDVAGFYSKKEGPQSARLHDGLVKLYDTL